jgi:hypothetical protein
MSNQENEASNHLVVLIGGPLAALVLESRLIDLPGHQCCRHDLSAWSHCVFSTKVPHPSGSPLDLLVSRIISSPMDTTRTPRILTHDERKAADAAFAGRPLNPAWSEAAKRVYEGLIHALPSLPDEPIVGRDENSPSNHVQAESSVTVPTVEAPKPDQSVALENQLEPVTDVSAKQLTANRQQAIQAGLLIDVSTVAQKLGLTFPVTVTKPLWEIGIAPSESISDEEKAQRLRDVLMAFRLRIASQTTLSPLIDFPAMLSMPPGEVPQPVPLFALIQPDEQNRAVATLLLPNEVSATIIPMN